MLTDITLDKDIYNVLASLDGSKLDAARASYFKTTLRQLWPSVSAVDDATRAKIKQLQTSW